MRRQLLVNGVMVALALGTLGVVWATRDAPTTSEVGARKDKLLPRWDKASVSRLLIARDGKQVELSPDPGGVEGDFRITRPWQERADIASVNALLGSLDLASLLRNADGASRSSAGVASPALQITVETGKSRSIVRLGGPAPAPVGARYAEVVIDDGPARIVTVSAGVAAELDVALDKFRDPRLLELGRSELAALDIWHDQGKVALRQSKPPPKADYRPGVTFFVERASGPELANRDGVDQIATALSRLVATAFVEPEQARALLAKDPAAVHVKLERMAKSGSPITFTLGGECPSSPEQRLALREEPARGGRAGCVPSDVVEALRVAEGKLLLDTPFAARVDEVESLRVSSSMSDTLPARSPEKLDLARKDAGFRMRSPAESEIPADAGNARILAIVRARAVRPASGAGSEAFTSGRVMVDVSASDKEVAGSEQVVLGAPRPDGSRCLKRDLDQVVLCVDAEAAKAFLPDATLLRTSVVTSFAVADVQELAIEIATLKQRVQRRADGSFALLEPAGFTHDGSLVTDALQALGALRAERWVAPTPSPAHGLETPRLRARASLSEDRAHELVVGAATTGGYFARLGEDPGVFVLARSTVDALMAPLVDRTLFPLPLEKVSKVELVGGSRRLELTRSGDTFRGEGLAPERATAWLETLSALRADFTVHLGPERPSEGLRSPSLVLTFTATGGERYRLRIGARDSVDGASIAYARLDSVDATFALAASTLTALQDF